MFSLPSDDLRNLYLYTRHIVFEFYIILQSITCRIRGESNNAKVKVQDGVVYQPINPRILVATEVHIENSMDNINQKAGEDDMGELTVVLNESMEQESSSGTTMEHERLKNKSKRNIVSCLRCRRRNLKCPGGLPCKKCMLAKSRCEYVEDDKNIVVSMKYLTKLQDDIGRLKQDNATLRKDMLNFGSGQRYTRGNPWGNYNGQRINSSLSGDSIEKYSAKSNYTRHHSDSIQSQYLQDDCNEYCQNNFDKYGRVIQSRTGEKVYVGSSSMTFFGLKIQDMLPSVLSDPFFIKRDLNNISNHSNPMENHRFGYFGKNEPEENKILEKEGNTYEITLAKTRTNPALSVNICLPSFADAILYVDTLVNYNDGCFYFFNEGLVKKYISNLYSGKVEENKRIRNRHIYKFRDEQNVNEPTVEEDTSLSETIWYCKILLIFAVGEMYLGSGSLRVSQNVEIDENTNSRHDDMSDPSKKNPPYWPSDNLPGASFFFQASELFAGLFSSGSIDNITKSGGIESVLLYAFYLQVADCVASSYFYFGMALRATLILGWHTDTEEHILNRFELEHRRRLWWTIYMYERMLSSKAGLPLSFTDHSVTTKLPSDFSADMSDYPAFDYDIRGLYTFRPSEPIKNCVLITQVNTEILSSLYFKHPVMNILPIVSESVQKLLTWEASLPSSLRANFADPNPKVLRLVVNIMTEYFQGINLAVRPLVYHLFSKRANELQKGNINTYIDLTKYSKSIWGLLNSSFRASINTIKSLWALFPSNMVALFGWMDREYLFTSAATLVLYSASFDVYAATRDHLDHALTIFNRMKKLGNFPAAYRRAQLLKLIRVLDFNGVMLDLLKAHTKDNNEIVTDVKYNSFGNLNVNLSLDMDMEPNYLRQREKSFSSTTNLQFPDIESETIVPSDHPSVDENFNFNLFSTSDLNLNNLYTNDTLGIEGYTYVDDEEKLWNEITDNAVWLNASQNHNFAPVYEEVESRTDNDDVNMSNESKRERFC